MAEKKITDPSEEMTEIYLMKDNDRYKGDVFVCVNGRRHHGSQRGKGQDQEKVCRRYKPFDGRGALGGKLCRQSGRIKKGTLSPFFLAKIKKPC